MAKKKAKSKRPKKGPPRGEESRGPRQQSIEGTSDELIQKLVDLGQELSEVREERMGLTRREHDLQQRILDEMKKREKEKYVYEDPGADTRLELTRVVESEKIRVRMKKRNPDPAPAE